MEAEPSLGVPWSGLFGTRRSMSFAPDGRIPIVGAVFFEGCHPSEGFSIYGAKIPLPSDEVTGFVRKIRLNIAIDPGFHIFPQLRAYLGVFVREIHPRYFVFLQCGSESAVAKSQHVSHGEDGGQDGDASDRGDGTSHIYEVIATPTQ